MIKKFLLTVLLILTFSCGAVFASIDNPKFNGLVADEAGMLMPDAEKKINQTLKDIKKKTGITVATILLKSINGQPIKVIGDNFLNNIKVTEPRKGYSIIFLLTDEEKLLHIVFGNELGNSVNTEDVENLLKSDVIPYIHRNQLADGIINGAKLLVDLVPKNNSNMILYGSIPAYKESNSFNLLWLLLIPAFFITGFAGWYIGNRSAKP